MALIPATRTEVIENRAFPRRLIDWSRPVAVLMVSILHFIRDEEEVAGFLAGFDLVPPGLVTTVEWGTDRPPPTGAGAILAAVGTVPAPAAQPAQAKE